MPTTPGGRYSPGDSEEWDLTTDLAAMQVSNETATANEISAIRQNYRVGTDSERTSLSGADLYAGLKFMVPATGIEWLRLATAWTWSPRNIARVEMSANQGITGSIVALSGLTTTFTAPFAGRFRMTLSVATFSPATTDLVKFTFRDGTTGIWAATDVTNSSPTQPLTGRTRTFVYEGTLTAGAHTLNVAANMAVGASATVASSAAERSFLSVDWLG